MTTHDPTTGHDRVEAYQEFLRRYYDDELAELIEQYPNDQRSLTIDFLDLFRFSPSVGDENNLATAFADHPEQERQWMEEALRQLDLPVDMSLADATVRVKPPENGSMKRSVTDIRTRDRGRYRGIDAQVTKVTKVKPVIKEAAFECQRCGTLTIIPQTSNEFSEPHECNGCERQGPFQINFDQSTFEDFQKIRLSQPPEEAAGAGDNMVAYHEGDAAGTVEPGDRIEMGGVIHLRQEENNRDNQPTFEPYLQAHVPVQKESDYANIDIDDHLDEIRAIAAGKYGDPYDLLVGSIDPAVNGFEEVKLALGLALFGGTRVEFGDGTHQRGDSHIMLLGDPGIGKSDLIEYVEKVAPRSAFASGKDASGPGMTAAAVQDDFGGGGWTLEAGALVRADGGVACIDEIDKVGEETIASLHTALEKQVVEVQKAGIDASLPARCTCFAAGNPKYGRFEDETPLSSQIDFDAALLSRFDRIFMLQDRPGQNEKQEEAITDHMIDFTNKGIKHTADSYRIADDDAEDISPAIPIERLRAYIAYARENIHPRIEDEAIKADLKQSFLEFRTANTDPDQPIPVTRRKLQGIFRLAQASARVRLSPIIEEQDINRARELIGRCLRDVGIDPETGQLDADIIETGTSKNQRDRIKTVYSIIEDLAAEHDAGAPHGEVIERAGAQGISADDVDHEIESLKDQGEIYEPRQEGHYHIV